MLGFNGGLVGQRRVPITSGAPGVWFSKFYTENCIVEHSLDGSSWTTFYALAPGQSYP
jgi:hypothetical protein